eukprot:GABV01000314.1.p1 GENE.GABV01000314.1~~GABV01000314.1.p1  ORF type:complete len:367 (+),score=115.60 GABV01000314.1:230-1330(+)
MDLLGKSDPFLEITRLREDGAFVTIFKSEIHKNTLNCEFSPIHLTLQKLCNGDFYRPLWFRVFDWDRGHDAELIGECEASLKELIDQQGLNKTLIRRANADNSKKRDKSYGNIIFKSTDFVRSSSFLDYLKGGLQVSFMVAIDFTGSNGNPASPDSLHFCMTNPINNPYTRAISDVGTVLEPYDSDRKFPVWGFGARIGQGGVDHCFSISTNPSDPEVYGVQGILDAYTKIMRSGQLTLSGPTLFQQIITTAAAMASQPYTATDQHYRVLLILTDGIINDLNQTIDAIVEASFLPLSIVIVGVGNADFSAMNFLDSDDKVLESSKNAVLPVISCSLSDSANLTGKVISVGWRLRLWLKFLVKSSRT